MRRLLNWYGPYVGAGVKIDYIAEDWKETRVSMRLRWYNANAFGTHFGGSLYAMIDPHFTLMLMNILGRDYYVWDKSAHIDFIKPGKGRVTASMRFNDEDIQRIKEATAAGEKYLPEYTVDIVDAQGEVVAHSHKVVYVRKKQKKALPEKRPTGVA